MSDIDPDAIDATKPATGEPASKADLRNNLSEIKTNFTTAKSEIEALQAQSWTYVALSAPFTSIVTSGADVTGFGFTPVANSRYIIEGTFLVQTVAATTGAVVGLSWPTGLITNVGEIRTAQTTTTTAARYFNGTSIATAAAISVATQDVDQPCFIKATLITGASPSGVFQVRFSTEIADSQATMSAGSWFRYRTY